MKRITPYLVEGNDGTLHFFAIDACRYFGYPATPRNIEILSQEFEKALRDRYPTTPIAHVERDGTLTERQGKNN
jgi:hypothetical protein